MGNAPGRYEVVWKGQAYDLSLRTSADGYVTAWQYGAVQILLGGILATDAKAPEEIYGNEAVMNRLLNIITREGYDHLAGTKRLPWDSWLELPPDVLRRIVTDFFLSLGPKTRSLPDSESSPTTSRERSLIGFVSDWWTLTTTDAAPPPKTLSPPGDSTPKEAAI